MQRAQVTAIAIAAAALAVFALVRLSGSTWVPLGGDTESEVEPAASDTHGKAGEVGGRGGEWGVVPRAGSAVAGPGGVKRAQPGGPGERAGAAGGAGTAGRGSAAVVPGGPSAAGRVVGGAAGLPGGARGGTGGSGAKIADVPGHAGSGKVERREQLVDFLAENAGEAKKAKDSDAADGTAPAEGEDDVMLSVPLDSASGTLAEDSTAPVVEEDLKFAEDGVGVKFDANSTLAFPDAGNVRGDAGSFTFDIEPEWNGGDEGDHSLVNIRTPNQPDNLLRLFKNGRYLRFIFADESGQERDISVPIDSWNAGERRTITATWGDALTSLYINDELVGTNTYEGQLQIRPGTPLYLGSDVPQAPATGANATISNFFVFGRALGRDEIGKRTSSR